eukprot:CAMPEP_0194266504 /NCGR_PEP_ID=MMETSP0169-20130528/1383_1 /TAXON_ID=218684 /ORGANISM="Corethron pennatum, Strain L29A3" /LENGTH=192 /DNA_ID=CAMNT_0039007205 /DNA_START=99 /DNA_END=677 /DNA_ORIENTATION=+
MGETQKHPLQHDWVLWEHIAGARNPSEWKQNMKMLGSFNTVEDFWCYFNHIPKPSQIFFDGENRKKVGPEGKVIEEYSIFKRGIDPQWEDPKNSTGGEFYCRRHMEPEQLNLYWQNIVLGVVGETLDGDENHINGVRVVDKGKTYPMFRIELWIDTKDVGVRDRLKARVVDCIQDGAPVSKKGHPQFEWKDH